MAKVKQRKVNTKVKEAETPVEVKEQVETQETPENTVETQDTQVGETNDANSTGNAEEEKLEVQEEETQEQTGSTDEETPEETEEPVKKPSSDRYIKTFEDRVRKLNGNLNTEEGALAAYNFIYAINTVVNRKSTNTKEEVAHIVDSIRESKQLTMHVAGGCSAKWSKDKSSHDAYIGLMAVVFGMDTEGVKLTRAGVSIRFKGDYTALGKELSDMVEPRTSIL
jgi:hypothetical protein